MKSKKDVPTTIRELIDYTADRYEEKPCMKYIKRGEVNTKTYREFRDDSFNVAYQIKSVAPTREHIGIIGKANYKYLTYLNGIFVSGNVAVPLSPDFSEEEMDYLFKKADVTTIIYDKRSEQKALKLKEDGNYKLIKIEKPENKHTPVDLGEENDEDCAMIMYTSGTTGGKKGVMLSSKAIVSNVFFKEMSYEGENVALNVLPIFHIFCFSCDYLKNLKDGVTICLNGDLNNIGENLLRFEPTVIRLVPMIVESLLRKVRILRKKNPELTPREAAEKVFGRKLKAIIASGAYLSPEIAAEFDSMGINLRQGYGMTETGPRIAVPNGKTSIYSVGVVIDICDIRVRDNEIQVKSPSLFTGYYKQPEETAEVFTEDGWFKTGDIGHVGEDRQLYITGRKKNLIILSNGENISPEEIEKKFQSDNAVSEVLVYGEKDRITAEFYLNPEYCLAHSVDEAKAYIKERVKEINLDSISEKEIAKVKFRDTPFDKTASGKIKRTIVSFEGGNKK